MPPKWLQPPSSAQSAKRTLRAFYYLWSVAVNVSANASLPDLSPSHLASLPAKTLQSHLKSYGLSNRGSKRAMAGHLYRFLHPTVQFTTDASPTPAITTPVTASASSPATVNILRQVMEQLSTFFQQFSHPLPYENTVVLSTTQDTLPSNITPLLTQWTIHLMWMRCSLQPQTQ